METRLPLTTGLPWIPVAVLFDRDGILVRNVPYNGDPALVCCMPGALRAVNRCRDAGLRLGVITNQSGVGRSLIDMPAVMSVATEIERQLGRFDTWQICPHAPWSTCACRKPRPALVQRAARALSVDVRDVVVIGDQESDVAAAANAGAQSILVPSDETPATAVAAARRVANGLEEAIDMALSGTLPGTCVAL